MSLSDSSVTGDQHSLPNTSQGQLPTPHLDAKPSVQRETPTKQPDRSLKKLQTEKITGYKTPGEYFLLSSKKFPNSITAVTLPSDYFVDSTRKYPLVLVFAGAGECIKPPRSGALAWMHYYKIDEAVRSLSKAKLESSDFRGLVKPEELDRFNRRLHEHPYQGIIIACPYSPPLSLGRTLDESDYEAYLTEELIPALISHYRVAEGRIGIDGVSMGGARSMYYGLKYPQMFMAIGTVQGAFGPYFEIYESLLQKNSDAIKKKALQLITSDGDSMRTSVQQMHELLDRYHVPHQYVRMTGPHDYVFNQGPGSLGLLVFHDQMLNSPKRDPKLH